MMSSESAQTGQPLSAPSNYYDKREEYFASKGESNWRTMLERMVSFLRHKGVETKNEHFAKGAYLCEQLYSRTKEINPKDPHWEIFFNSFVMLDCEKDFFRIAASCGCRSTFVVQNELRLITREPGKRIEDIVEELQEDGFRLHALKRLSGVTKSKKHDGPRMLRAEFRDSTNPKGVRVIEFMRSSEALPEGSKLRAEVAAGEAIGKCHEYAFDYVLGNEAELHTGFFSYDFGDCERSHSWAEIKDEAGKTMVMDLSRDIIIDKQDFVDLFGITHDTKYNFNRDWHVGIKSEEELGQKLLAEINKFQDFVLSYGYNRDVKERSAFAKRIEAMEYTPKTNSTKDEPVSNPK